MMMFSPPVVEESNPISLLSGDAVQTCNVITNSTAAIVLVDSASFMGTFTLYISDDQSEGQRTVSCRVIASDGTPTTDITTFFVGLPSPITSDSLEFEVSGSLSENTMQVPVDVSWDSPNNTEEFMLQIMNSDYSTTVRSVESNVTVLLPPGTYSATLCAINRCGRECRDYTNNRVVAQLPPDNSSVVIALAVVVGLLCLLLVVTCIVCSILVICCTPKKDKKKAQKTIPADEMKME